MFDNQEVNELLDYLCAWMDVQANYDRQKAKFEPGAKTLKYAWKMIERAEEGRRKFPATKL